MLSWLLTISLYGQEEGICEVEWAYRLDSIVSTGLLETTQAAVVVYDLTADTTIFSYNGRQRMRPASTMKIITAVSALDLLGVDWQFRTTLKYKGSVAGRVLWGDIYCVGGFDPMFGTDDLQAFVSGVQRMGIDTIRGSVVADKTFKSVDKWGEGWCWDDDNPDLSPLLLRGEDVVAERLTVALRRAGIVVEGGYKEGYAPSGSFDICSRTHSIDQVLPRMMKQSDNQYAEAMFYQIASLSGLPYAEASHARDRISGLIERLGLDPKDYYIADGSGLSLYDYVSAELEVAFLRHAYSHNEIFAHLYPSLSVAGVDGTLKKRLLGKKTSGNVHAKTGTLTAITSLAGYLTAQDGHLLCFCIINQGLVGSTRPGRRLQDSIIKELCGE